MINLLYLYTCNMLLAMHIHLRCLEYTLLASDNHVSVNVVM